MPEGPEIRRAADQIATVLVDQPITGLHFTFKDLSRFEKKLAQSTIVRVDTRGKAMLTRFANGMVIYSHNQLYGVWKTVKAGKPMPNSKRKLRLTIHTPLGSALLYSASDIEVLRDKQLHKHPFLAKLGPDILSEQPSAAMIVERLTAPAFTRRQLATLLLDQQFLAGIGNYLRAEILFHAQLGPTLKPQQCSQKQLNTLAKSILMLTHRAYRTGGITNPASRVKSLKSQGLTHRESYRFSCYGRENLPCYVCEGSIVREERSGRSLYFCPQCQAG
ncbi:MAG: endonuclease VIII [Pseudomonadota bacterium]